MDDAPEPKPERSTTTHAALATGAAALALILGMIATLIVLGLVLKAFGYGVMLLVAIGGLLLVGAIIDLRRKRRGRQADGADERSG
jgi:uncharacterized membrane protein YdcZ (DUF606 family)